MKDDRIKMPGNVKLGSSSDPDPDPTPFLFVSMETKRNDMLKPYDAKKSMWCPDEEGGFSEALVQSDDGKKAVVLIGHEVRILGKYTFPFALLVKSFDPD